jgi:very-short-patch-repair endonuclease
MHRISAMKRRRLIHNVTSVNDKRKELRGSLTPAEAFLWNHLKNRQLDGKKFRRQHSIGPYIVDFFCPECRVIVELDGAGHMTQLGAEADAQRSEFLKRFNVAVIRFENKRVFENIEAVLEEIRKHLGTTPSAPG